MEIEKESPVAGWGKENTDQTTDNLLCGKTEILITFM